MFLLTPLQILDVSAMSWVMKKHAMPNSADRMIRLPIPMMEAISEFRFDARLRTEADAIRRLLAAGLRAEREAMAAKQKDAAA